MVDWIKIRTEYVTEPGSSYRELCDKYHVSMTALSVRAKKEGWVAQKQKYRETLVTNNLKSAEKNAMRYRNVLYRAAARVAEQIDGLVKDASMTDLAKIGLKPRDITGAIKDLEDALHIKSAADLEEQEARIAKLRKEAEAGADSSCVKIEIVGGDEAWRE